MSDTTSLPPELEGLSKDMAATSSSPEPARSCLSTYQLRW